MMNRKLTASLLALALVLGMPSFAALAETPTNMNGWTKISFGNPAKNIQILDSGAKVGDTSIPNGAGFRISDAQGSAGFSMSGASVPVHFETNVTAKPNQAITSTSMITIDDHVTVLAPSITFVRTDPANSASKLTVTQYPVAVIVPGTREGDLLSITYSDGTQAVRPVSTDAKAYLYLSAGTHRFTVQKQGALSPVYGFDVTVNSNGSQSGGTTAAYSFSGGDGTAAHPFEITTADQLRQLSNIDLGLSSKAFLLKNDVTLSGWNAGIPVFSGSFNGGSHTVTLGGSAPLFDLISGSVSDLTVNGAVSNPGNINLAALARESKGTILRCASGASVTASSGNAGGLVSYQSGGTIQDSKFTGSVNIGGNNSSAGGIVSYQEAGQIVSCISSASRISGANAGGITGYTAPGGVISQCFSTNTIDGGNGNAGGIAGRSAGTISNSYSFSQVSGSNAGGITGQLDGGEVRTCYQSNGAVSAQSAGGGIVGWQTGGSITGSIALAPSVSGARDKTGRISGTAGNYTNNKAWEGMPVSYLSSDSGSSTKNGDRLTNADIQNANTFANMGFSTAGGFNAPVSGYLPTLAAAGSATSAPTPGYTRTSSSSSSSTGGGGGGGGNNEPPYSETFWENMRDRIDDADRGDKIKFSSSKLDNMPTSILRQLKGKNITLEISHGSKKIIINGKRMYDIPKNRVFYTFDDLYDLYKTQPASSSKPASSSTPVQESKPLPPVTSPGTGGTTATPPPVISTPVSSSSAPESSSSSAPESSSIPELPEPSSREDVAADETEDKETDTKPEQKRSAVPLVIAGIVIVAALAGGGAALYYGYYKKKTDEWTDDFDSGKK